MSTGQSIASPRAPRGHRQPSASQPAQENINNNGRHSQRRPRGGRNHNNAAHASPSKPPNADPALSEGGAYTTDDARAPTGSRNGKKHTHGQPSHDRTFSPRGAQTSLTDTEAASSRISATPLKNQGAYAGPTFHASPAPSALPIPKFLSRSVPAKTAPGPPTPPLDNSSDSANSPSPSPSPLRAPIAIPARHEDSPLDMLFRADKAERAKNTAFSPSAHPVRPQPQQPEHNVFPIELDGEGRNSHMSPPRFQSSGAHRSMTDPSRVPQLKDVQQPNTGNDVMQDLMNRLSMSQKQPQAPAATPPRQAAQASRNFQSPQFTPSPFHTGRPSVNRSVSGPSTPAQAPQEGPDFFYGNRNLSPMFKAAQGDTPKRNSGLRTEVTADSPTVQQSMFQDFPSIPSANAIDPNTFSRGQPTSGGQGPANTRRGSVPYGQNQQRQPNKHVTQTPGRYQQRQDAHQRGRGNFHGQGPRHGRPTANAPPASAPKPATTMMSFVPASVSAKPKPKPEQQQAASAPPSAAAPPPQTSTSDTLALEQDLKRMLNLSMTGEGVR
ncbi:hypothetical protein BU25DRAFT_227738 [Macroventuria anomochaeta]|uniref:Uncharacterized protein n=1 Tax=Macroventuria anomochaeta TaxID=301207 RepID=A0ACB6SDD5_9PLEO|nr:uncharacterized protein BU25DRAFT_227738 [Macroventuria anomochaeta]KAF2631319.1 hypothetical protein BU25DRAFT_227738 [Macroventuria anomochaeta]